MQKNAQADAKNILAEKIHAFLISESEHGRYKFKAHSPGFSLARFGFFLFGLFGILLTMLHGLIIYMALTSELTDRFWLAYRSFIFPTALCFVFFAAAVLLMFFKKEKTATVFSVASVLPIVLELIQLLSDSYSASYKTALVVMYFLTLFVPICAFVCCMLKRADRKDEEQRCAEAIRKIYARAGGDGIMSNEELSAAAEAFSPKL